MKKRTSILLFVLDFVIVHAAFNITALIKGGFTNNFYYSPQYLLFALILSIIWLAVSIVYQKFTFRPDQSFLKISARIIRINLFITAFIALFIFALRVNDYSRFIVFNTIIVATLLEGLTAYFQYLIKTSHVGEPTIQSSNQSFADNKATIATEQPQTIEPLSPDIQEAVRQEAGASVYSFLQRFINLSTNDHLILSTSTQFNIDRLPDQRYNSIINLKRINDIRYINKFFESVNEKLPLHGKFVGCAETKEERKQRLLLKYPYILNIIYYSLDFIVKRIFPKFFITKKIYFLLTRGENRVISEAEILGRLYSCGFKIVQRQEINSYLFFVVQKVSDPAFDENPTYGAFIKLPRIGKHGKIIYVYKFRTMHPFAEYIQDFLYKSNDLQEGGKFHKDFRITTLGRIFRKLWLDEIPMLINLLKGDLKLVGVRPLSRHYFNLYSTETQQKRIQYKPGLIPPFYVDLPQTLEEIQESELRYLERYDRHPWRTDMYYLYKALINIIIRRKRSH